MDIQEIIDKYLEKIRFLNELNTMIRDKYSVGYQQNDTEIKTLLDVIKDLEQLKK